MRALDLFKKADLIDYVKPTLIGGGLGASVMGLKGLLENKKDESSEVKRKRLVNNLITGFGLGGLAGAGYHGFKELFPKTTPYAPSVPSVPETQPNFNPRALDNSGEPDISMFNPSGVDYLSDKQDITKDIVSSDGFGTDIFSPKVNELENQISNQLDTVKRDRLFDQFAQQPLPNLDIPPINKSHDWFTGTGMTLGAPLGLLGAGGRLGNWAANKMEALNPLYDALPATNSALIDKIVAEHGNNPKKAFDALRLAPANQQSKYTHLNELELLEKLTRGNSNPAQVQKAVKNLSPLARTELLVNSLGYPANIAEKITPDLTIPAGAGMPPDIAADPVLRADWEAANPSEPNPLDLLMAKLQRGRQGYGSPITDPTGRVANPLMDYFIARNPTATPEEIKLMVDAEILSGSANRLPADMLRNPLIAEKVTPGNALNNMSAQASRILGRAGVGGAAGGAGLIIGNKLQHALEDRYRSAYNAAELERQSQNNAHYAEDLLRSFRAQNELSNPPPPLK